MLPEKLSTDLTSLGEGQERMAMVVEMVVGADGTVEASDIYRAVVVNRAKLAYYSVAAWLDGASPAPAPVPAVSGLDQQIRIQDRVAQAMRGLRQRHGALSLETIEARPVFDGDVLTDLAVMPFSARQIDLLRHLTHLGTPEPFVLIGAGALGCFLDLRGRGTADLDLTHTI